LVSAWIKCEGKFFDETVETPGFDAVGIIIDDALVLGGRFAWVGDGLHIREAELRGEELSQSIAIVSMTGTVDDVDLGLFGGDGTLVTLQDIEVEDVTGEVTRFVPIASAGGESEHRDAAVSGDVDDSQDAIGFPGIDDSGGDSMCVECSGDFEEGRDLVLGDVGADIVAECIQELIHCERIGERLSRKDFFSDSLEYDLLALGAAEISLGIIVAFAGVLESGGAVECLPALGDGEYFVAVIRTGVSGIVEIAFDIDAHAANSIDDLLKAVEIGDDEIMDRESGDEADGLFGVGDTLAFIIADGVERIDFGGGRCGIPDRNEEIAWDGEETDTVIDGIEAEDNDGISEEIAGLVNARDTEEENIDDALIVMMECLTWIFFGGGKLGEGLPG